MEGAVRSGRAAAALEPPQRAARMTVASAELTALDRAVDAGVAPPARAPAPRRLVGRRARVERDDDRRSTCSGSTSSASATPSTDRKLANELLARRRDDGTWSIWFDGPADLSTSIEAYVALKMAGVDPGPATPRYIRREGGIPKSRVFTKCFLALLGHWPWQRIAADPAELDPAPADGAVLGLQLRLLGAADVRPALRRAGAAAGARRSTSTCARSARAPASRGPPAGRTRSAAARSRAAERWVRDRQEADGGWGGIQPPWVWSIIMLAALGHGFEDDTLRRAVDGWSGFMVDDGDRLRPEACQSPIWDTALAVLALRDAGVPADHPQLVQGRRVAARRGDRRSRATGRSAAPTSRPAGWAFEFENDLYPDIDDTAVVCSRCSTRASATRRPRRAASAASTGSSACSRANGGWGAFDVDNTSDWLYKLPFCDFGDVIDPPSEDVTAHALEVLAPAARVRRRGRARRRLPAPSAAGRTAPGGAAGA